MTEALANFWQSLSWGETVALSVLLFLVTFAGSLALTAWVLVKLPATYFRNDHPPALSGRHPILRWSGLILKNIAGLVLVLVGVLLSLPGVPGQGVLTILIGLILLDFPGKRRLEQWLITRPRVFRAVNGLRARFDAPSLVVGDGNHQTEGERGEDGTNV